MPISAPPTEPLWSRVGGARGVNERSFFCQNVAVRPRVKWAKMTHTGQMHARTVVGTMHSTLIYYYAPGTYQTPP